MIDADAALAWFKQEIETEGRAYEETKRRGRTITSSVHYGRLDGYVRAAVHLGLADWAEMRALADAAVGETGYPEGEDTGEES